MVHSFVNHGPGGRHGAYLRKYPRAFLSLPSHQALLLGARRAIGVDVESQALTATRRNARLNGDQLSSRLHVYECDEGGQSSGVRPAGEGGPAGAAGAPGGAEAVSADLLVANILVGPVVGLAPLFAR